MRSAHVLVILLLGAAPAAARPAPATACHCFTSRTFDPARPAAADPYILATARSSLLSAAYAVPKAGLVQEVMSGADPDDLWVAFWAGARSSRDPPELLAARKRAGGWKAALSGTDPARLPPGFRAALERGGSAAELAGMAVDDVLASRMAARPEDLAALRRAGATSPETILATLLGGRTGTRPQEVLARFRTGTVSWGMLLDGAGMKPKDIDAVVRQSMR